MMRLCLPSRLRKATHVLRSACLGMIAPLILGLPTSAALAQAIVLSVNGDPITSVDIEQRAKLLRALHKPATKDAVVESMIAERLKNREASRFGIIIKDEEIGEQAQIDAKKVKVSPQQLVADIQKNGVSAEHMKNFFKAELGYSVLIKALNRGVEASEIAVRQELAKEKTKGGVINYSIRQVVFTLNPGDGPAAVSASVKEAEALRGRFTSCASGIPYAKSLPGVAVREKLNRTSTQLGDSVFKDLLDKTPVGHLTQPSRSANGIELIAVCDRSTSKDDSDLRKAISDRLLNEHMEQETAAKYKEMRSRAVIERR